MTIFFPLVFPGFLQFVPGVFVEGGIQKPLSPVIVGRSVDTTLGRGRSPLAQRGSAFGETTARLSGVMRPMRHAKVQVSLKLTDSQFNPGGTEQE